MPDPRAPSTSEPAPPGSGPPAPRGRRGASTPVLWFLLSVAVALNALSSAGVLPLAVGIGCGVVTLACAALLVAARVRHR